MASNLPGHYSNAERVAWRYPTSDVIGSHIREDADSYLMLLRRKIQEKYINNQELIKGIMLCFFYVFCYVLQSLFLYVTLDATIYVSVVFLLTTDKITLFDS